MDLIRIKGVGFNEFSEPDSEIITNESFSANKQYLIVSNYPIPKGVNVYMEYMITSSEVLHTIRHLPIYLGLHKDPSMGITNNDCIFMSCYYSTLMSGFRLFERHLENNILERSEEVVDSVDTKIPIVNSIIGLGVSEEGSISIWNNGLKYYEFKPSFELDDSFYFALFSNQSGKIKGRLNFGRIKLAYIPEDYYSLYQIYFPSSYRSTYIMDRPSENIMEGTRLSKLFDCKLEIEDTPYPVDELTNTRHVYLDDHKTNEKLQTSFTMSSNGENEMIDLNLPCPMSPVYMELQVTNTTMGKNDVGFPYIGMPLEVGLTIKKNNITSSSFRLLLYHIRGSNYMACSVFDNEEHYYVFPVAKNPCQPLQPNVIGLEFKRTESLIVVYTGGRVYAEVPIEGIDVSDNEDDYYIFIRSADHVYKDQLYGYVSLGTEQTSYLVPEGSMTIYDYWNSGIRYYLDEDPEISCHLTVVSAYDAINRDFYGQVSVEKDESSRVGLNLLFDTHNIVTDGKTHRNEPNVSMVELRELMYTEGKL